MVFVSLFWDSPEQIRKVISIFAIANERKLRTTPADEEQTSILLRQPEGSLAMSFHSQTRGSYQEPLGTNWSHWFPIGLHWFFISSTFLQTQLCL